MASFWMAASDSKQVKKKKIIVHFADFEQVKKIIVHFVVFKQVKKTLISKFPWEKPDA